jgi:hypothetical protein
MRPPHLQVKTSQFSELIVFLSQGRLYAIRLESPTEELPSLCMSRHERSSATGTVRSIHQLLAYGWKRKGSSRFGKGE